MKPSLLRGLWLAFFFVGALASILYVFGFRFEFASKDLVPTGVVELTTSPPGAIVFLDGKFVGLTPQVLRGQPLKTLEVRFEKSGFQPFVAQLTVNKDFISHLRQIFLLPLEMERQVISLGEVQEIFWDPEKRGYLRILPLQKAVQIVDFLEDKKQLLEFSNSPEGVVFSPDGIPEIVFPATASIKLDAFSKRLFNSWEEVQKAARISSESGQSVSFQGRNIFLKAATGGKVVAQAEFETPLLGAWWLLESDDILVATEGGLFLWNAVLKEKRPVLSPLVMAEAFFLPDQQLFIYKDDKKWNSINFGLLTPFSCSPLCSPKT